MAKIKSLIAFGSLAMSATANASPPMASDVIAEIRGALPQCSGGWIDSGPRGEVSPGDLLPRLDRLSRSSSELDEAAGTDLYQIAKGLLAPATGAPKWVLDGNAYLKCPSHPKAGLLVMQYLVGEQPDDGRGPSNALEWLGLAYATGAGDVKDPAKARRYFLRFQMHVGTSPSDRWADGIDNNLIANADRAGMRPYLEALARTKLQGAVVRVALADAKQSSNPTEARRLLLYPSDRTLNRLLQLEDQKLVPTFSDATEIAVWADASRSLFGYRKYVRRMIKAVEAVNGGTIPTSPQRPPIALFQAHLDSESVADTYATRDPIPVRALVNPEGRAIYIEACRPVPSPTALGPVLTVQLSAARLYNVRNIASLPSLPIVTLNGHPTHGWVMLPAVQFKRDDKDKLEVSFTELPPERCLYSGIAEAPSPQMVR